MKRKASTDQILVVTLVLAMVLALPGVGCGLISPPASSIDSPSMSGGISLTISEPEDNTITDVGTIEVRGHTTPGAIVSVNAVVTVADVNGDFDAIVSLEEGPNIIQTVASDETGDQASVTLIVTLVKEG